jgi:hypothetical protein
MVSVVLYNLVKVYDFAVALKLLIYGTEFSDLYWFLELFK